MSTAHHSRKSPLPDCELRQRDVQVTTCDGREQIVLVSLDGTEQWLCPGHAAAVWLTDPTFRFSAKTPLEGVSAVMRQAFGDGGGRR
ncbi:hypothetical protein KVH07_08610 [Streptomyces olivaceus]|uniref:hypothetical protein n=1 Tax=Streptomyces olivaceus TaxID=47716 RepID=UPI001CCFBF62|nr:hypothetical protein [Streptomyces olivaceus]MBZ6192996.1 hypothetical protein [Streptomyces olivaceus]